RAVGIGSRIRVGLGGGHHSLRISSGFGANETASPSPPPAREGGTAGAAQRSRTLSRARLMTTRVVASAPAPYQRLNERAESRFMVRFRESRIDGALSTAHANQRLSSRSPVIRLTFINRAFLAAFQQISRPPDNS